MTVSITQTVIDVTLQGEGSPISLQVQNAPQVSLTIQQGIAGVGVPNGGTTGQVLAKASNADSDTEWVDAGSGGGGGLNPGDLIVRYDAVQPVFDCLWVSPSGAVILITES